MINIGNLATFIAFPLLHAAAGGDSPGALAGGVALMAFSMCAPFLARKCTQ